MYAARIFTQNNGDVTKEYYARMNAEGPLGELAVALFRAQKRSTAAKAYRGGKYRSAAYDVKSWSLTEVCRIMGVHEFGLLWGWKYDGSAINFEWVLYVELPTGQCSFHSAERLAGPDYQGTWIPQPGSLPAILEFCDLIWNPERKKEPQCESLDSNSSTGATTPSLF